MITVSQASTAIPVTPIFSRFMRSVTPVSVTSAVRRPYRSASPPANTSRNSAPNPIPWIRPHHSLLVKLIATSPAVLVVERWLTAVATPRRYGQHTSRVRA